MIDIKQRTEELSGHGPPMDPLSTMSMTDLLHSFFRNCFQLITAEAELVRIEVQGELIAEVMMTRRLIIGAVLLMLGIGLAIMAIILAFSAYIPTWLSCSVIGAVFIVSGASVIVLAWKRQRSLAQVEEQLKEKLLWSSKMEK